MKTQNNFYMIIALKNIIILDKIIFHHANCIVINI